MTQFNSLWNGVAFCNISLSALSVTLFFFYLLQSSPYSCGAGEVGCSLQTDPTLAVGPPKPWHLQQPPSGKTLNTRLSSPCPLNSLVHAHTAPIQMQNSRKQFEAKICLPFSNVAPIQSTERLFWCFSSVSNTNERCLSISQCNMMKDRRRIEVRWGTSAPSTAAVKHIPLPHPSDNSYMEKNERGSALVSSSPCTVLSHSLTVTTSDGYAVEFTLPGFSTCTCHKPKPSTCWKGLCVFQQCVCYMLYIVYW